MPRFCWLAQTYYSLKTIIQMALNANEEEKVRQLLTAFESGKRISELDAATGSMSDMQVAVVDESGETRRMNLQRPSRRQATPSQAAGGTKRPLRPPPRGITALCRP